MKLYYYKLPDGTKNFGDTLNGWLWEKLLPGVFDEDATITLVGIGTLLNDNLPSRTRNAAKRLIFSTGVGYGTGIPQLDDSYKIYCVRGPLSAKALGLPPELAVTDGALLTRKVFTNQIPKTHKFAYMPHYELAGEGWSLVCKNIGFAYIDPRWDTEKIISGISQTEILITEAMHGAIIADALRVPWIPVVTNSSILPFKWQDWCGSIDVEYKPVEMDRLHHPRRDSKDWLILARLARDAVRNKKAEAQLVRIAKTVQPTLSSDRKIEHLTAQLEEKLEQLKHDIETEYCVS
ncbi:MAG: polysaccharide pyruvyl transferase family protein [Planktothrix sp.]